MFADFPDDTSLPGVKFLHIISLIGVMCSDVESDYFTNLVPEHEESKREYLVAKLL